MKSIYLLHRTSLCDQSKIEKTVLFNVMSFYDHFQWHKPDGKYGEGKPWRHFLSFLSEECDVNKEARNREKTNYLKSIDNVIPHKNEIFTLTFNVVNLVHKIIQLTQE